MMDNSIFNKKLSEFIYSNKKKKQLKYELICCNFISYTELCSISKDFLLDPNSEILKCHNYYYTNKFDIKNKEDFNLIFNQLPLEKQASCLEYPLNLKINYSSFLNLININTTQNKFKFISPSFFKYFNLSLEDLNETINVFNKNNCLFVFEIRLKHLHLCSNNLYPILYISNNYKNRNLTINLLENYLTDCLILSDTTKIYLNKLQDSLFIDLNKSKGIISNSTTTILLGILKDKKTFEYLIKMSNGLEKIIYDTLTNHIINKEIIYDYLSILDRA